MSIINTVLTLKDLPPPPPSKVGWPWTEQSEPVPERMPDGADWIRISVVTPSYNQGQFIEETIRSVLLQGYPHIELIIIDGGSTDNTVEIIKKYEQYIAYWVSEPDRGQSHALNKGFRRATGQLVGWQNSDDYYYPDAFKYAAQTAATHQDVDVIYGLISRVDSNGALLGIGTPILCLDGMIFGIDNQSTFLRQRVLQRNSLINESFKYCMDQEFFWRLALEKHKFLFNDEIKSFFRVHPSSKGSTLIEVAQRECLLLCNSLYTNKNISRESRKKLLPYIRGLYLIDYARLNLSVFRKNIINLFFTKEIAVVDFQLASRYISSFLGRRNIELIRSIKNFCR